MYDSSRRQNHGKRIAEMDSDVCSDLAAHEDTSRHCVTKRNMSSVVH